MADTAPFVVLCTVPNEEVATNLAREVVGERCAACVNIIPGIRSVYQWQGKIEDDGELLLVIKTTKARFPELRDTIERIHPYEVPEILALPVEAGAPPYLAWLARETRKEQ